MKKAGINRKIAIFCCICVVVLVVIWISTRIFAETLYSTDSPNQLYKVEITQTRAFPFVDERAVYLNAYRNGKSVARRKLLYTGDFLDNDFRDLYPNPRFRSDSIYELGGLGGKGGVKDVGLKQWDGDLKVFNETSSKISYLLIETGWYKLVILDVEPRASVDLSFQYLGGLSCQGQFAESKEHFASAVAILNGPGEGVNAQFLIRVREDGATIESPQLSLQRSHCCASDRPDPEHEWFY